MRERERAGRGESSKMRESMIDSLLLDRIVHDLG